MYQKTKLIPPHLRYLIRGICNKAGISTGKPSDKTLMRRFYRAKEVWQNKKEEYDKNNFWFDGSIEHNVNPKEAAREHLRIIEEVESILFEEQFLTGGNND